MSKVQKISVSLPVEMTHLINDAVISGDYASSSEVIREALRDWKQKRLIQLQNIEQIQQLWQEGLESGPGQLKNIEEIKQEARQRLKQQS
jgi:antitoxin ParD1/3/4